jgi:hypothetical protein
VNQVGISYPNHVLAASFSLNFDVTVFKAWLPRKLHHVLFPAATVLRVRQAMKEFTVLAFELAEASFVFVAGIRLAPDCAFVNH